jgi:hypothetical protein
MTSFLDKKGLERYHNNAANTFAAKSDVASLTQRVENLENNDGSSGDLTEYYTKIETDAAIEVVASVTACAVNEIKNTIGASDALKVSFEGTKNLSTCSSIMDALHVLDDGVSSEEIEALQKGKADKSTTLSGYGIDDAYTKSEVDAMLKNYYPKKEIDNKISSMENTINELKSMLGVMGVISIGATGKDGDYTLQLLSTTGGGLPQGPSGGSTSSSIDGSTLVCGGTVENNSLVLTGATIDGNTLVL